MTTPIVRTVRRLVAPIVVAALLLSGCSQPGEGGYLVVAEFPQAVSLFEQSRVKVMGVDVGHVAKVEILGDHIRVELRIDREVPLPVDVLAAIVPLSLIGERNVMLSPAWQPGDERLEDGHEIGLDRTRVPVEADEALKAFTELANAVDPDEVGRLLSGAAGALDGQGERINNVLVRTESLTGVLAEQDEELLDLATTIGDLAATLTSREARLGDLLSTYAEATELLADERADVERFVASLARLSATGDDLLDTYEDDLPEDIASLARLIAVLQADVGRVQEFTEQIPVVTTALFDAYRPADRGLLLRFRPASSPSSPFGPLGGAGLTSTRGGRR